MSNSGKVLFNGFVSSKSKKSNNKNRRNIRKISREEIQQIKNQSVKKYDNKHRIFNINKNRLKQNYRNNYNNIGNYRNNYIKNAGIINKSKNNQHNINSSYSSSTSKVLFSNASSNSSSNYYNILDNYNFSDGLNVIKSVNLNGKNIKSITTSKSTVKLITLKDTTGCDLNFIFNIEGGPQGEQGPDGKSLTSVTYTLGQDVGTTSDVIFDTVNGRDIAVDGSNLDSLIAIGLSGLTADEVNQLKNIDSTTISSTQWGYLGAMDQDVNTSAAVTFNTVNGRDITVDGNNLDALTTIGLTGLTTAEVNQLKNIDSTTISTTQWGYLGAMDQDVNTTAGVTFNSITVTGSQFIYLNQDELVRIKGSGDGNIDFFTNNVFILRIAKNEIRPDILPYNLGKSTNRFDTLYLGTSIILNGTTINATQWNRLATIDQDLSTTSDVTFDTVSLSGNSLKFSNGSTTADIFLATNETLRLNFNSNASQYALTLNKFGMYVAGTNKRNLGLSGARWDGLYLSSGGFIELGPGVGTQIASAQWNILSTYQTLRTDNDVRFNSLTLPAAFNKFRLSSQCWIQSRNQNQFNIGDSNTSRYVIGNIFIYPTNNNLRDVGTSSNRFQNLYLGTSINLNATTIGTTQWDILSTYQTLRTNNDVRFNSVLVPLGNNGGETPIILGPPGTAKIGLMANNNNRIILHPSKNSTSANYKMALTDFWPQQNNARDLGKTAQRWKNLYLSQKANVGQLNISDPTVPASIGASGTTGDIEWGDDGGGTDHLYVCIGTDSWKRLALSTW